MRFGVSPLSLEFVIEKILKEKGLSGFAEFSLSELVEGVAKTGYKHFEITFDIFQVFPIQINDDEIERLKNIKRKYDITYSAHLPFISLELASPNKFIREASINSIVDSYETFIELENDIEFYVLHPTGQFIADAMDFIKGPDIFPVAIELFTNSSIQSIKEILDKTGVNSQKIVIETIEFPLDATIKMVKKLNTKLCIDTAHILGGFSGDYDLVEITDKYLELTGEIHLQDYNDDNLLSDHCALGTGSNFPPEFLNLIHRKNFEGPIVFELPKKDIIASLEYIKKYAPQIKIPNIDNHYF
jgi:sugar phosphate isomerase/epimerase